MQHAILVNSKHDIRIGKLFNMRNLYFTNFEIDFWRGEVLAELLRKRAWSARPSLRADRQRNFLFG